MTLKPATGGDRATDGALQPAPGEARLAAAPAKSPLHESHELIVNYPGGSFAGPFTSYGEAVRAGRRHRGDDHFVVRRLDEISQSGSAEPRSGDFRRTS